MLKLSRKELLQRLVVSLGGVVPFWLLWAFVIVRYVELQFALLQPVESLSFWHGVLVFFRMSCGVTIWCHLELHLFLLCGVASFSRMSCRVASFSRMWCRVAFFGPVPYGVTVCHTELHSTPWHRESHSCHVERLSSPWHCVPRVKNHSALFCSAFPRVSCGGMFLSSKSSWCHAQLHSCDIQLPSSLCHAKMHSCVLGSCICLPCAMRSPFSSC